MVDTGFFATLRMTNSGLIALFMQESIMTPVHHISGIILAAGASERMGFPKANLKYADGSTLLARQVKTLMIGGIQNIYVVTGAHTSQIKELNSGLDVKWIENPGWQTGQFSSVQAGLSAALDADSEGSLILPVDTVNITSEVVTAIIGTALANPHLAAVVPENNGRRGHPVYLSAAFMKMAAGFDPQSPDSRLDTQLKKAKQKIVLPVSESNILNNINSLEDWERFRDW